MRERKRESERERGRETDGGNVEKGGVESSP